jgi:DNA repair photolyase
VPSASTIKQASRLVEYGVKDPDSEWGDYLLVRKWDEEKFRASLRIAENTPRSELKPDGNRAVIYCSTTDPYQVPKHPEKTKQQELAKAARIIVRRSLEVIRDESTLNVRILTRSPLARSDFDLFKTFQHRLLFGMSVPTLRNDLARVYEPRAPAPSQRLATLKTAHDMGLHVYVAVAPTYPECNEDDLRETLGAIKEIDPITIFHEPINIRAENVARIKAQADQVGIPLRTDVFETKESWEKYALDSLKTVHRVAGELGLRKKLHLWPDRSLGTPTAIRRMTKRDEYERWLNRCWSRVSEWPKAA